MDISKELEKRYIRKKEFYNGTSSRKDQFLIYNRVFLIKPNVIYVYELPLVTEYSIKIMSAKVFELLEQSGRPGIVIDISESKIPSPKIRHLLMKLYRGIKVSIMVLYTGKNILINIPVRFIAASIMGNKNFQVVENREEAIEIARNESR